MKDLLLLLLTIIFVILSIFYIVSVCNYDIKELFIDKYSAIGVKCNLDNPLVQINDLRNDAKYTSEVLRGNGKVIEVIDDYHTAYKCDTDTYNNQYLTKYTDITYKTIDKELEDDLYEKMKALGNMTKKLRELDSALSNLQSIESDLYSEFSDIFDSDPYVEEFSDLNIDQHSHEYSIKNQDIKVVFDDFFS